MSEPSPLADSILDTLDRGASLTDRVYERLRRGLIVGVWEPGDRLSAVRGCLHLVQSKSFREGEKAAIADHQTRCLATPPIDSAAAVQERGTEAGQLSDPPARSAPPPNDFSLLVAAREFGRPVNAAEVESDVRS